MGNEKYIVYAKRDVKVRLLPCHLAVAVVHYINFALMQIADVKEQDVMISK